ncbi:hydrolase-like protein [Podospora didyma]|uniref:Hydrolase-like protein n=1 Tax=Podospora didyma TaxID=330526 RepID=A0AAE0P5G2_9PEZI|nr:hydrolase-like protein [Podospora didyma]
MTSGTNTNGEEDGPPPPTFEGRLKLQEFILDASTGAGGAARRSPRLLPPTSLPLPGAAAPSPLRSGGRSRSSTSSPAKRKPPSSESDETSTTRSSNSKKPRNNSSSSKKKQSSSGYAPPSTYAHLPLLPDAIGPNLLVLFVGLNPGIETARTGHAYAHPTNHFWRLLHSSGVTPRLCSPTEDRDMPALFSLGLTNIVARPTRNGSELSKAEMDAGVALLEEKARRWRPEVVCVVGKSIWESVWRVRHSGRGIRPEEFRYGWQEEGEDMGVISGGQGQDPGEMEDGVDYSGEWKGAKVFVASSTSGLAATLKPAEKEQIWRSLGAWVERRREERKGV